MENIQALTKDSRERINSERKEEFKTLLLKSWSEIDRKIHLEATKGSCSYFFLNDFPKLYSYLDDIYREEERNKLCIIYFKDFLKEKGFIYLGSGLIYWGEEENRYCCLIQ